MRHLLSRTYSFRSITFLHTTLLCALFMFATYLAVQPAYADTRTVTNTLDAGGGSLRQVVIDASPGDIIVFDSTVFSVPLTITLTSGQILIDKSLTIDGAVGGVFTPTVSGNGTSRVFVVNAAANVKLNHLNIADGNTNLTPGGAGIYNLGVLTVTDSVLVSNVTTNTLSNGLGGGIYNDTDSSLYLANSLLTNNRADQGGGVYNGYHAVTSISNTKFVANTGLFGGGISNINAGNLSVQGSVFQGNYASDYGGAIYSVSPLVILSSTFSGNASLYGGGAIQNYGLLNLSNSSFINNVAGTIGGALNISHGTVAISNSSFVSNTSYLYGGGINSHTHTVLNVSNSTFVANKTLDTYSFGGGIANDGDSLLSVTGSSFASNTTNSSGGAIEDSGFLNVSDSTILSNSAGASGGGLYIASPGITITVTNSSFVNNTTISGSGGGIVVYTGTLNVLNSAFVSNTVGNGGGGLSNAGGSVVLLNSTFWGNQSTNSSSGGIYNCGNGCILSIIDSTIVHNASPNTYAGGITNDGIASLTNTIVAYNTAFNCSGNSFTNSANNLDSGSTCGFNPVNGSLNNANPLLGELGYYGGNVQTIPLLPGSPAIDAGTCTGMLVPATDARGIARPQPLGGACDIGAFESQGFTFGIPRGTPQSTLTGRAFNVPLSVSVTSNYSEPVDGGLVTFSVPSSSASATLQPPPPLTLTGGEVATTAHANVIAGTYVITGSARGVTGSVYFNLTNQPTMYTLTVSIKGKGSVLTNPLGPSYVSGTVVTLTATPDTGSSLVNWSSGVSGTGQVVTLTMDSDKTITATFNVNTYMLTVQMIGNGAGTIARTPPGNTFDYKTVVTLTAMPAGGSMFMGWSANCTLAGSDCIMTMTNNTLVTATFSLKSYTLTMAIYGSGTVTPEIGTHTYLYGTNVSLKASPQTGWGLVGWSGDLPAVGRTNPITVTINGNKTITATFGELPVADAGVSHSVNSNSKVTLDGSSSYGLHLPLDYMWSQTGGQVVVLNSTAISQPVFTAPAAVTMSQNITFTLIVTDQVGLPSVPSQVTITVIPFKVHIPVLYKQ